MVKRKVTVDDVEYVLKPLTRRQFKSLQPIDDTTLEKALELSLEPETAESLEDLPLYVSKQLFDEVMDFSSGGQAEKN